MSNFFRDGWDFGIVTLVIGLPIVAVIAYFFGAMTWDLVTRPTENWLTWLMLLSPLIGHFLGRATRYALGRSDVTEESPYG